MRTSILAAGSTAPATAYAFGENRAQSSLGPVAPLPCPLHDTLAGDLLRRPTIHTTLR